MKSRWLGYDKNQIRVYFTSFQAGHQKQLDKLEEMRINLEIDIEFINREINQLQAQLEEWEVRHENILMLEPRAEAVRMRICRQARQQARELADKADREVKRLTIEGEEVRKQVMLRQLWFNDQITAAVGSYLKGV